MDYKTKILLLGLLPHNVRQRIVFRRFREEVESTGEAELLELRKIIKRGDHALDIGCNLGVYTYEMSRLGGHVIAFEPNPTLAAFVKSFAANGVEVHQVALSSENGTAELNIPLDSARGHGFASVLPGFLTGELETIKVLARTIDSFDLPKVAFMKIDVEGFEQQVINGGLKTIARDLPFLLIEIGWPDLDGIKTSLSTYGYKGAFFHDGTWRPIGEFEHERFQNVDRRREQMQHAPTRRELEFINNFLFVPPHRQIAELN